MKDVYPILPSGHHRRFWSDLQRVVGADAAPFCSTVSIVMVGQNPPTLRTVGDYFYDALAERLINDAPRSLADVWHDLPNRGLRIATGPHVAGKSYWHEVDTTATQRFWDDVTTALRLENPLLSSEIEIKVAGSDPTVTSRLDQYFFHAVKTRIAEDLEPPDPDLRRSLGPTLAYRRPARKPSQ